MPGANFHAMVMAGQRGNDQYTKLLLHLDAAISDGSGSARGAPTSEGSIAASSAQSKFGGSSLRFDGTDDAIYYGDSADWDFSTSFAIDLWVRQTSSLTGTRTIITKQPVASDPGVAAFLIWSNGGTLEFYASSAGASYNISNATGFGTLSLDTWAHIAVTWDGTNYRCFKDGSLNATVASSSAIWDSNNPLLIGRATSGGGAPISFFNGWMDEIRVSKGHARWTAAFTAPGQPYS